MTVAVVNAPAQPLLSADRVREQLAFGPDVPDARIDALVAAATAVLDGPQGWLGRALRKWTLELRLDRFPFGEGEIELPFPPIVAVASIAYTDLVGSPQTFAAGLWQLDDGGSDEGILSPAYGHDWPMARRRPGAVRIRYDVGNVAGDVPAPILQAIVLQVAATNAMLRKNPSLASETVPGVLSRSWASADIGEIYDKAAMRLLGPYRVFA